MLDALARQGVEVVQFHPEYAAGQFELSVAASSPVDTADISVLVRTTIRAVGQRHGLRTSYSPKVDAAGVGNGGHLHVSLWRDGTNLMAGGSGAHGLSEDGAGFVAGVLAELPALLAVGAPSAASYLRLVPQHWAGAYACWGLENREAALRLVTGSAYEAPALENLEVKCFDLHANPYLAIAAVLVAGTRGMRDAAALPDPVEVDPAVLPDQAQPVRLPTSQAESLAALLADETLTAALGPSLVASLRAIRESEIELFADATPERVAGASRWAH